MRRYLSDLFINRNYALFMGGSFVSATGSWFLTVTIGWLMWEVGRSEFLLGLASFAQMGPLLTFGLLGGVLADRMERRSLLLICQVVGVSVSLALATLAVANLASVPAILLLLLVMGFSQAFSWPAWSPFIADLVGPERLRTAVALNSARFNLTRIIGPSLAGLLLASAGGAACLAITAVCQVSLLATLKAIQIGTDKPGFDHKPWLAALNEGLRCALDTPAVREPMFVSAAMGIAILPYVVFLPAYAQDILKIGPEGLGLLFTSIGIGAIAGAVLSGQKVVASSPRRAQGIFACGTGLALMVFALSTIPLLSSSALFFVGLGSIGYLSTANATVQLSVPREVVGRVIGLWTVVNSGTTPLGGLVLGAIAERTGLGITLAAASALAVVFSAVIMLRAARVSPAALSKQEPSPSVHRR